MKSYTVAHCHSTYSLSDGLSLPKDIAKRAKEIGAPAVALTDHGNVNGAIEFLEEMKEIEVQPILGCELYISQQNAEVRNSENRSHDHLLVYAKNDDGWRTLLKIIEYANRPEHFYYRPRLSLNELAQFADGNLVVVNGHIGSCLGNTIIQKDRAHNKAQVKWFCDTFGKENFFLEAQPVGCKHISDCQVILDEIRQLSQLLGISAICTPDAHYCRREQAELQRILLCKSLGNITLDQGKESGMSTFFKTNDWHIPTYDEMIEYGATEEELHNTLVFADRFSTYKKILHPPVLPKFECPEGYDENSWLRQLCIEGWKKKIKGKIPKEKEQEYGDRVKHELSELQKADLSSYFLILQDIIKWTKDSGWLTGVGRGSACGCMVSYLIGITEVDPIPYGLLFSRFWNSSRKESMPDCDIDVPKYARNDIFNYLVNKYGKDKVGHIITFQTMQGRAALKDVFRAYGTVSAEEMNRMTKNLPDPAKIAGELQEMKEEEGESSLIRYTLDHDDSGKLKEWCYVDEDGKLAGPYAQQFEQAIALEGVKTSQSKHPAGIIISPTNLSDTFPMVYDPKIKAQIIGYSMDYAEKVGGVKIDCLGILMLDKIMGVQQILETGDIEPHD